MESSPSSNADGKSRPTKAFSCVRCFDRKVKCTKQIPCTNCTKAGVECVFRQPAPPRRRKKKTPEEVLMVRLRRYESLLRSHGIDPASGDGKDSDGGDEGEVAARQTGDDHSLGLSLDSVMNLGSADVNSIRKDPGKLVIEQGRTKFFENNLWANLGDELRSGEDILEHSSEEDVDDNDLGQASPETTTYAHGPHSVEFVLGLSSTNAPLSSLHPAPSYIYKLWQVFLENINPLTKVIHQPTLQSEIFDASFNLAKVPKGLEALMFAIYTSAVNSLSEKDCMEMFQDEKADLLARYQLGTRKALVRANFLATSELSILQAFVIYLLSMRLHYDPRTMWILSGVAARMAQSLGLHRDGTTLGLPPFDTEMRRRLWWQCIILDSRSAELSGSAKAFDFRGWNTKIPANVNDADLYPQMTAPPLEFEGATEMISCSLRYEMGDFLRKSQMMSKTGINDDWPIIKPGVTIEEKDKAIDELEKIIQNKFVRYCDPTIPVHFHALLVARAAISSMRLMAHHPSNRPLNTEREMSQEELDKEFSLSLKILENGNLGHSTPAFFCFLWHSHVFFQWQAFIYLVSELRHRTEGEEVDKAWAQLAEMYKHHPIFLTDTKRPLHVATGSLCLKAYNAREQALARKAGGFAPMPPDYIVILRQQRSKTSQSNKNNNSGNMAGRLPPQSLPQMNPDILQQLSGTEFNFSGIDESTMLADFSMEEFSPMKWDDWDNLVQGYGNGGMIQDWTNSIVIT